MFRTGWPSLRSLRRVSPPRSLSRLLRDSCPRTPRGSQVSVTSAMRHHLEPCLRGHENDPTCAGPPGAGAFAQSPYHDASSFAMPPQQSYSLPLPLVQIPARSRSPPPPSSRRTSRCAPFLQPRANHPQHIRHRFFNYCSDPSCTTIPLIRKRL